MKRNDYDGSGKLGEAIAALYGCSPKNNNRIAELVATAKAELGFVSKTKKIPDDVKLAIWQWHFDRLHPEADVDVKIISQPDSNELVELFSQTETLLVDIISQTGHDDVVDIISQSDSNEPVEIISQYADTALVRIAFYIQRQGKRVRQVIALDGFYINGLIAATGITRQDAPKWVQQAVDSWRAFDAHLPITRQVKYLIVRAMTEAVNGE